MTIKNKYPTIIQSTIIIILLFNACSQTPYEQEVEKKIVAYGHLSNTREASLWLTSSINMGSSKKRIPTIENARVNLYENDTFIEQLKHEQAGHYKGAYLPKADTKYTIELLADGYPDAQCIVKTPKSLNATQELLKVEKNYFDTTYVYMEIINGDTIYRDVVVKDTIIDLAIDFEFTEQENNAIYRSQWLHTKKMEYEPYTPFTYSTPGSTNSNPELEFNYSFYFQKKYRFNEGIGKGTRVEVTLTKSFVSTEVEFPIIISYHFEQLTQDSWDFYEQYDEYRKAMSNIQTNKDSSMWVNPNENESMLNYIPYVFITNIEGGLGYITCGSGIGESIIIEKGSVE